MTRHKRTLLAVGLLVAAAAVGAVLFNLLWSPPAPQMSINIKAFRQIRLGATLKEVEAILGGPAGDYAARPANSGSISSLPPISTLGLVRNDRDRIWSGDTDVITVTFDEDDRVVGKGLDSLVPESMLVRLRRRLGL